MNATSFDGAYLYGVDFQGATVKSVNFHGAVLVGASFAGASLSSDPNRGQTRFTGAYLQGARLGDTAQMENVSFQDAFLDFNPNGNALFIKLDGTLADFHGWKTPGQDVCLQGLQTLYGHPTTVPETNSTLTCPNGTTAGQGGCGPTVGTSTPAPPCAIPGCNLRWRSGVLDLTQASPPGSYFNDSTYIKAAANPVCVPKAGDDEW
jgi:uncharacterized protein YjbI with pentapeptide repeats